MVDLAKRERSQTVASTVGGGIVGYLLGALTARPAAAAASEDKLEYITSLIEIIAGLLQSNRDQNVQIISLLQQIALAGGPIIAVSTPWVAKEPVIIMDHIAIRAAGNYQSDRIVDFRNMKRLFIKIESSLDQAALIQLVGNTVESFNLVTNVGAPVLCPANGNISFGLAWDDWQPFIGVTLNLAAAPVAGVITIYAVEQE